MISTVLTSVDASIYNYLLPLLILYSLYHEQAEQSITSCNDESLLF